MFNLNEAELDACYAAFRKHCVELHGLESHADAHVILDLQVWTLKLLE